MRGIRPVLRACAVLAAGPLVVSMAVAQGKIDQKLLMRYGGVLAPDCGNYMLPQLKYLGETLVVQDGGKAVLTGRNVKAVPQYFGAKPPPEFETALTSDVGGEAMVSVFWRNASGLHARRRPAGGRGHRARAAVEGAIPTRELARNRTPKRSPRGLSPGPIRPFSSSPS